LNVKIQKHHDEGDYIQKHQISKSERKRLVVDTSFNNDTIQKVDFENDEKSIFTPTNEVIGQLKCNQTLPSNHRSKYTSIT
jgi:ribosomal protein L18